MSSAWRDPDFQEKLIALLCRDKKFLVQCSHLLDPDDFKPKGHDGIERWVVASAALDYWHKYRDKIGSMLKAEMLDFSREQRYSESQRKQLLSEVRKISDIELTGTEHIEKKVIRYKREQQKLAAMEELIRLQETGELTDEAWITICQKAVDSYVGNGFGSTDYFLDSELQNRIVRRERYRMRKFPLLFIDPIDEDVRVISRGHLGLVMAPYKKGKSLFLAHIALAYALQGLKVLFYTLEDPRPDVEDRLDSMITNLPLKRLHDMPVKVRNRFQQFVRLVRGRLKIVDGTEGGMSVGRIVEVFERERQLGYLADSVVVDYDDEIVPSQKRKERRLEFSDIYRDFGQFLRKHGIIGWLAAQTVRKTENRKVIGGDTIAEDISKIRKVTCAIGIGQGDWGEESLYLYIAAHKHDRQHIGWNIMSDRNRMVFYDRERTREMVQKEIDVAKQDSGDID